MGVFGVRVQWIGEHDPNNNNGWIEWDVPLGGEVDEPMVDPEFDKEEMDDDDDDDDDVEWLMAPVMPRGLLIAIGEIHPRVATIEEQLKTRVAEMESHMGILMSYMLWMEEHLTVLEKRLPGPPLGPQSSFPFFSDLTGLGSVV
nr:hypothetical protein [Tanacetum cinerariifolium]